MRRSRRSTARILVLLSALVDVDILGVRLQVHNPLLHKGRVKKDDLPSAGERWVHILVDILVLVFVAVLQPILVNDPPPPSLRTTELARE